jgi:hypothetical protein
MSFEDLDPVEEAVSILVHDLYESLKNLPVGGRIAIDKTTPWVFDVYGGCPELCDSLNLMMKELELDMVMHPELYEGEE